MSMVDVRVSDSPRGHIVEPALEDLLQMLRQIVEEGRHVVEPARVLLVVEALVLL